MTNYELLRRCLANKADTLRVEKLPEPNPDDYIVWGEGEVDQALAELAEIEAANDPHDCTSIATDGVSEADDERHSRPEPY